MIRITLREALTLVLAGLCLLVGCQVPATIKPPYKATISGRSMLPYLHKGDVVWIVNLDYKDLKEGMVAVRRTSMYDVAHGIIHQNPDGSWVMRGSYNDQDDSWPLTPDNYVGVVKASPEGPVLTVPIR